MATTNTKVQICNMALTKVGEQRITSLTDESKNAILCDLLYDQVYDEVLRAHPWNCALFRAELAQDATAPAYGWTYRYALPSSPYCLRVLHMEKMEQVFSIEGRYLVTDEGTAKILYIGRVENPDELDSMCTKVLYLSLALALAYNLTENNTVANGIYAELEEAWRQARSMDAQEGSVMWEDESEWLNSRLGKIGYGIYNSNIR